jgi:quinol monooxygenase YgiN
MSNRLTLVRQKAKPGKRDEVRRVWEKYVRAYADGNTGFQSVFYCYDDKDPDAAIVVSLAADAAAQQEFAMQPWVADYQRETAPLLAAQPEVMTATPQYVKGA